MSVTEQQIEDYREFSEFAVDKVLLAIRAEFGGEDSVQAALDLARSGIDPKAACAFARCLVVAKYGPQ